MLRCSFLIFLQHQKSVEIKGYKERREGVSYERRGDRERQETVALE